MKSTIVNNNIKGKIKTTRAAAIKYESKSSPMLEE